MRQHLRRASIGFALLAIACASGGTRPVATPRHSTTVITADEIAQAEGVVSLYDVIQRLRPQWLTGPRARNTGTQNQLVVYLESNRYGSVESLRQLPVGGVVELRLLSAAEATNRYGIGHAGGAIVITLSEK